MPIISDFIHRKTSTGSIPVQTIVRCYDETIPGSDAVDEVVSSSNGAFTLTTTTSNSHKLHFLGFIKDGFITEITVETGVIPV